jgi:hypothetical protein
MIFYVTTIELLKEENQQKDDNIKDAMPFTYVLILWRIKQNF